MLSSPCKHLDLDVTSDQVCEFILHLPLCVGWTSILVSEVHFIKQIWSLNSIYGSSYLSGSIVCC